MNIINDHEPITVNTSSETSIKAQEIDAVAVDLDHKAAYIHSQEGVLGVEFRVPDKPAAQRISVGHENLAAIMNQTFKLYAAVEAQGLDANVKISRHIRHGQHVAKGVRVVLGSMITVVVQVEGNIRVALATPTGHAVAKSLRRMIRRQSREKGTRNRG